MDSDGSRDDRTPNPKTEHEPASATTVAADDPRPDTTPGVPSGSDTSSPPPAGPADRRLGPFLEKLCTAVLEKAAQFSSVRLPRALRFIRITIPDAVTLEEVRVQDVAGWDADDKRASQRFGDEWFDERRSLILLVPSLAAPGLERNVLINQRHPQFRRVRSTDPQPISCHPNLLV